MPLTQTVRKLNYDQTPPATVEWQDAPMRSVRGVNILNLSPPRLGTHYPHPHAHCHEIIDTSNYVPWRKPLVVQVSLCQDGIWRWCVTLTAPYGTCRHATRPRGHSGNKVRASVTQYRQSVCSVYTAAYLGFFFVAELINYRRYRYSSRVCISLYDFTLILQI